MPRRPAARPPRARWRAARTPDPLPPLSPAGECAALVRGRLLLLALPDREVRGTARWRGRPRRRRRERLERAEAEVVRLALAARPDSLTHALTACAAAEGEWLRALAGGCRPARRTVSQRRGSGTSACARRCSTAWSARSSRPCRSRRERPWSQRRSGTRSRWNGSGPTRPPCSSCRAPGKADRAWPRWPAPGSASSRRAQWRGTGGRRRRPLARTRSLGRALPTARRAGRRRGSVPAEAAGSPVRDARRAWDTDLGWLHVVSGPDRGRIAHAAGILAGSFLQRGHRVLLVDAGRGLRLHERFGGDTRWGLGECLAGRSHC